MKLVLDTNIYCDFAEGIAEVVDTIAENGDLIFMPAVVIGELVYGFMKGTRQRFNENKLKEVIQRLGIEIIKIDEDIARKYASIYLSLQIKRNKIPINDVWIAASSAGVGGTLLTRDKHFEVVEGVDTMILT
ncbi:MAG: PIN domain-containing protein [Desulfohalobiaceae bacterium]|nr:PIN domain-containing protein [Desulfohalobiaceae bacterium]